MSHFTVLVIGDDPERQLAPYHEFECTGDDNEFVQDIDITEEVREEYDGRDDPKQGFAAFAADWHGLRVIGPGAEPDLAGEDKYGYVQLDENGEVARVIDRTNPDRKWDWYQLGGRWTGFFQLKPTARGAAVGEPGLMTAEAVAGTADQARKGDIDFGTMRLLAEAKAGHHWDDVQRLTGGQPWRTWAEVREECGEDLEWARRLYHAQSAIQALQGSDYHWEPDEYAVSRDAYTTRARLRAVSTFAVVKDGQWHEKGRMGWFACVSDEKDEDAWLAEFAALLDGLPDDTLLSVYDCHI
jgi:hypothetical protein